ncbi:hypothetical protein VP01_265g11 [Puccinia sorghi]|uniref:Uncharacterized protein n=1 Tax=Puccinia sorghi TaxID=27349 RepID=A0A0L6V452_9BASI|nr:hypothetical protein VP01_265g11 [Puccinia sorghi]
MQIEDKEEGNKKKKVKVEEEAPKKNKAKLEEEAPQKKKAKLEEEAPQKKKAKEGEEAPKKKFCPILTTPNLMDAEAFKWFPIQRVQWYKNHSDIDNIYFVLNMIKFESSGPCHVGNWMLMPTFGDVIANTFKYPRQFPPLHSIYLPFQTLFLKQWPQNAMTKDIYWEVKYTEFFQLNIQLKTKYGPNKKKIIKLC